MRGKFPKTKLAIVVASLLSVAAISGALAVPQTEPAEEAPPAAAVPAPQQPEPLPPLIIRRVYVIRRTPGGAPEIAPAAAPSLQPAPAAPPDPAPPAAPQPPQQPITRSRGS